MNESTLNSWIVVQNNLNQKIIQDAKNGNIIALVNLRYNNLDENANLISAAPDLLKALENLMEQADLGEVNEETEQLVIAARNAIAKAKVKVKV